LIGWRQPPEDGVARFRNRLRGIKDRIRAGTLGEADAEARIQAWEAHAAFAQRGRSFERIVGWRTAGPSPSAELKAAVLLWAALEATTARPLRDRRVQIG
jgi:hypothetical protein